VAATTPKGRVVHLLLTNGVALYVAHTNADVAPEHGVSDALAAAVGLVDVRPLEASERGLGRLGDVAAPMTLVDFADAVVKLLPGTAWGIRVAGSPQREIRTAAVAGGSCGDLAATAAAAGADVLLTSDLKHHRTSEALEETGIALIDAAHWATEQPWLAVAASVLAEELASAGTTVECTVSTTVTDPFTVHAH
jgi:putative NIF3 family GTP cyclohydrolase 1 type 2